MMLLVLPPGFPLSSTLRMPPSKLTLRNSMMIASCLAAGLVQVLDERSPVLLRMSCTTAVHILGHCRMRGFFTIAMLVPFLAIAIASGALASEGQMTWALHFSPTPTWFDPAE